MTTPSSNGPPTGITPSEVWSRIAHAKRPRNVVDYPRKGDDGKPLSHIAVTVVSQSDLMSCHAAAEEYAQKMLARSPNRGADSLGYKGVFNGAMSCELLVRACESAETPGLKFFPSVEELRKWLVPSEIAVLFNHYVDWQHTSGPILGQMTEPEMDQWLDLLEEGGRRDPLAALSSEVLTDLLMHSASRRRKSRTATTSSGAPPAESPPVAGSLNEGELPPPVTVEG